MTLLSTREVSSNDRYFAQQIDTPDGFHAMERQWRELFMMSACPSVFSSWEWVSEWYAHFVPKISQEGGSVAPLLVAVYNRRRDLIGITAFIEIRTPCFLIGERRLIQIGLLCCDGVEPEEPVLLCRPGRERETISAMREHLASASPVGRWNHFTMQSHHHSAAFADVSWSKRHFPSWEQSRMTPGPFTVSLPQTWEEFRSRLGKSMRHNLPYYRRRLTRTGLPWAVRLLETPDEVEESVPLLASLHKQRAKSPRGYPHLDHLPTTTHTDFLARCLPLLAARGMAFVAVLEVDGVPIAAQAFLQSAGVVTFYYSGFDPSWHEFSPITIIGEAVIQRAISQGMSKINFLSEQKQWKTRWRAQPEGATQFLVGFSPHPISFAYAAVRRVWRLRHI